MVLKKKKKASSFLYNHDLFGGLEYMPKFDEYTALTEIKDGKLLAEFKVEDYEWEDGKEPTIWPTRLMVLATLTYHGKNAYMEIPNTCWTARAAKMAVTADYHAIDVIPETYKTPCAAAFVDAYLKQTRKEMPEYLAMLRKQPDVFQLACARINPGLSKTPINTWRPSNNMARSMPLPTKLGGEFALNFSGDEELAEDDELTPDNFLTLPIEEQTSELLDKLLELQEDFPDDFILRLSIPLRNSRYFAAQGNMEMSEFWKSRIIPYLNRDICIKIATMHPEAAIKTPLYLTKEMVMNFWNKKKETCSDRELSAWFLKFPKDYLSPEMKDDLYVTWQVLRHAPEIFVGTDEARRYLLKHPNDVLQLPEYQTPGILLLDGVRLNPKTLDMIKNEKFREKVRLALNIR